MPAALSALAQVPGPWVRVTLTGLSGAIICPRGVCSEMRVLSCEYTCSQLKNPLWRLGFLPNSPNTKLTSYRDISDV